MHRSGDSIILEDSVITSLQKFLLIIYFKILINFFIAKITIVQI